MALQTADRIRDTSTTTGTGAFTVSGTAPQGYNTFSSVMSTSDTAYIAIQNQSTNEWEVSLATYSSANTLTRTTILSSSNSGSAVSFSAGTKDVFITLPAAKVPIRDASGNATALGTPASINLANATNLPISAIASLGTSVSTVLGTATNASGGVYTYGTILPAAMYPALTGDVTNTGGTLATTVSKIGGMSVTLAGSLTTSGAYALTVTTTGTTSVTLPTSGTLASLGGANTWTGTQTLNGTSSALAAVLLDAAEAVNIVAGAPASTTNFYVQSGAVQYYTSNASVNWTLNIAFSSGTSLNTAMAVGQSVTIALVTTQGTTAYYNSAVTIDGSAVTPYWLGGAVPTAGNASGIDVYTYTVIKTASATYTVLASQTKF